MKGNKNKRGMDIKKRAYDKSVDIIKQCCTKHGIYASAHGYTAIWARDSMIAFLGASLIDDKMFKECFKETLINLSKYQSKLGEIPNNIDLWDKRRKHKVTFASIDSSLWYIIGLHIYAKRYKEKTLLNRSKKNIDKALLWIQYQDAGKDGLPEQQPTTDWQDAFPHKYGHVLNTQALYYEALKMVGKKSKAKKIKGLINGRLRKDLDFFYHEKGFYLPYIWKSHDDVREEAHWFDSLGNLLMIVFGAADKAKGKLVMEYIKKNRVNRPYPVKALYPVFRKGTKEWKKYFEKCDAKLPYHYLNGGIWPYIGGFYVLALIKYKRFKEAEKELDKLAESILKGNSPEWLDGKTGKPYGKLQAWNVGMYILAYESLKKKRVLL